MGVPPWPSDDPTATAAPSSRNELVLVDAPFTEVGVLPARRAVGVLGEFSIKADPKNGWFISV